MAVKLWKVLPLQEWKELMKEHGEKHSIQNNTLIDSESGMKEQRDQPQIDQMGSGSSSIQVNIKDESLLEYIPDRLKDKALKILRILQKNKRFTWDSQGQVSYDGKSIPFSHLSDLLYAAVRPVPAKNHDYPGIHQLITTLRELNVPQTLLSPNFRDAVYKGTLEVKQKPDFKWVRFDSKYKMFKN